MTKEELDFIGSMNMFDEISNEAYKKIVCHCEEQEPCDDAISRHDAIRLADELKNDLPDDERLADMVMSHNEGILEYQTQLSLLPSVNPQEPKTDWIPVSERLPEKPNVYTVTDSKGDVVRFVFNDTESSREYWLRCAKAWMFIKPYIEDGETE